METYFAPERRNPYRTSSPSFVQAIMARPNLSLAVMLGVFALFAVLIWQLPKSYVSQMKVRIGADDEARYTPPPAVQGVAANEGDDRAARRKLDMEVMESHDTLTQIVLAAGLQKLEVASDGFVGETSALTIGKAVERLKENLKVERVAGTNILDVRCSGPSPEIASATLQALASIYPKARAALFHDSNHYRFLNHQSMAWRSQLNAAENELVDFRRINSRFVLPEEREALGKRSIEAQGAFETADAQVTQYRRKVAEARAKLQAVMVTTPSADPALQSARAALIATESELAGLEALRNHLKGTADAYREQMYRLADAEIRDEALLRRVKHSEQVYLLYSKWQEQSRISQSLARESTTNFAIVQRPTVPLDPAAPQVGIDLALSFLLSVLCGVAAALWAEYLTPKGLRKYAAMRSIPATFEVIS